MSEKRSKADIKQKPSKLRSEPFLGQEVKSSIAHLEEVIRANVKVMKDDEIATRKAGPSKKDVSHLLESPNSVVEYQIDNIMERYNEISKMKDIFLEGINRESTVREISRQELFNESKLRMNLPKFSGYDLKLDIYSSQSDFRKIYKDNNKKDNARYIEEYTVGRKCTISLPSGARN